MVQGQLHKKMKNNVNIYLPETKRYLTILHGEMICSVIDSPFTSMKMDIYHQLRNLRISAEKVGEQVITRFQDLTEREAAAIQPDYEERLFTVEYLNGKEWDKIYKSLLAEIAAAKPVKVKKEKPGKKDKQEVPPTELDKALEAAEPEMVTVPLDGAEMVIPSKKATKSTKPTKPVAKPTPKKKAKK